MALLIMLAGCAPATPSAATTPTSGPGPSASPTVPVTIGELTLVSQERDGSLASFTLCGRVTGAATTIMSDAVLRVGDLALTQFYPDASGWLERSTGLTCYSPDFAYGPATLGQSVTLVVPRIRIRPADTLQRDVCAVHRRLLVERQSPFQIECLYDPETDTTGLRFTRVPAGLTSLEAMRGLELALADYVEGPWQFEARVDTSAALTASEEAGMGVLPVRETPVGITVWIDGVARGPDRLVVRVCHDRPDYSFDPRSIWLQWNGTLLEGRTVEAYGDLPITLQPHCATQLFPVGPGPGPEVTTLVVGTVLRISLRTPEACAKARRRLLEQDPPIGIECRPGDSGIEAVIVDKPADMSEGKAQALVYSALDEPIVGLWSLRVAVPTTPAP